MTERFSFGTRLGEKLWRSLPRVYREQDATDDLAVTLDAFGGVLDSIHQLIATRLKDTTPEQCQDWLIPYFAELFHERLVSPDMAGQRRELGQAILWRKQKGTLRALEGLAEAVLESEVEVQEGFARVAATPRINQPLLPASAYGESERSSRSAAEQALHPGLPAVTLDFRRRSRAVSVTSANLASKSSRFPPRPEPISGIVLGEPVPMEWQQKGLRGVPAFADSYQDVSRCIADLRTPDSRHGHAHPRRLIVRARPPGGFFSDVTRTGGISTSPLPGGGTMVRSASEQRLVLDSLDLSQSEAPLRVADVDVLGELTLPTGLVELQRVAAKHVRGGTGSLRARNSLFSNIAREGSVELEYCTVFDEVRVSSLAASDCIFGGALLGFDDGELGVRCIRFSNLRRDDLTALETRGVPRFQLSSEPVRFLVPEAGFGALGTGVLDPELGPAVTQGAEDGGELGAYHHRHHLTRLRAFADKAREFAPVGQVVVVQYDSTLNCPPPTETLP